MLLEQVLHIMLNQDYPRSVIISTENIWTFALRYISENGRTRQTLWSAVQMLTQKLCCQTIHDCPKVVPLHYESE